MAATVVASPGWRSDHHHHPHSSSGSSSSGSAGDEAGALAYPRGVVLPTPVAPDVTTLELAWNARGLSLPPDLTLYATLQAVTLAFNRLQSATLWGAGAPPLARLRRLDLSHNDLMGSLPPLAPACPGLEVLDVSYNALHDLTLASGATALRVLRAHHNAMQSLRGALEVVSTLPALTTVTLHDNPCTSRLAALDASARAAAAAASGAPPAARRPSAKDRVRAAVSEAAASSGGSGGGDDGGGSATPAPPSAPLPLEAATLAVLHRCDSVKQCVLASPLRMLGLGDMPSLADTAGLGNTVTPLRANAPRAVIGRGTGGVGHLGAALPSGVSPIADGGDGWGADFTAATVAACVVVVTPALVDAAHAWACSPDAVAFDAVLAEVDAELAVSGTLPSPTAASMGGGGDGTPAAAGAGSTGSRRHGAGPRTAARAAGGGGAAPPLPPPSSGGSSGGGGGGDAGGSSRPVAAEGTRSGGIPPPAGGRSGAAPGGGGSFRAPLSRISEEREPASTRDGGGAASGRQRAFPVRRVSGVISSHIPPPASPAASRTGGGAPAAPASPPDVPVPGEIDAVAAAECDAGYRVTYSGRVLEGASGGGVEGEADGGVALRVRVDGSASCRWPGGTPALEVSADLRAGSALRRYADLVGSAGSGGEEDEVDDARRELATAAAFRLVGYSRETAAAKLWRTVDVDGFGVGYVNGSAGATLLRFTDDGSGYHADLRGYIMRRWNSMGEIVYVAPGFALWEAGGGSHPAAAPPAPASGGVDASPALRARRRHSLPQPLAPPPGAVLPAIPRAAASGRGGGGGGAAGGSSGASAAGVPADGSPHLPRRWSRVRPRSARSWLSPRRAQQRVPDGTGSTLRGTIPAAAAAGGAGGREDDGDDADTLSLRESVMGDLYASPDNSPPPAAATAARVARSRGQCYMASPNAAGYFLGRHMAVVYNMRSHELKLYLACKAFRYELAVASSTGSAASSSSAAGSATDHHRSAPGLPTARRLSSGGSGGAIGVLPDTPPVAAPALAAPAPAPARAPAAPAAPAVPAAPARSGKPTPPAAKAAPSGGGSPSKSLTRPARPPNSSSSSSGGGGSSGSGGAASKSGGGATAAAQPVPPAAPALLVSSAATTATTSGSKVPSPLVPSPPSSGASASNGAPARRPPLGGGRAAATSSDAGRRAGGRPTAPPPAVHGSAARLAKPPGKAPLMKVRPPAAAAAAAAAATTSASNTASAGGSAPTAGAKAVASLPRVVPDAPPESPMGRGGEEDGSLRGGSRHTEDATALRDDEIAAAAAAVAAGVGAGDHTPAFDLGEGESPLPEFDRADTGRDSEASFAGLGDAPIADTARDDDGGRDSAGLSPTDSTAEPFPVSLGPVRSASVLAAEVAEADGSGASVLGSPKDDRPVVTPVMTIRAASFRQGSGAMPSVDDATSAPTP